MRVNYCKFMNLPDACCTSCDADVLRGKAVWENYVEKHRVRAPVRGPKRKIGKHQKI